MSYSIESNDNFSENTNIDGDVEILPLTEEEYNIDYKGDAEVGVVTSTGDDTVGTGAGDATVYTAEGDDEITAGTGHDILRGGEGNDEIYGGPGADVLLGGAGDDTLRGGLPGIDKDGNLNPILDEEGNPILNEDGSLKLGDTLKGGSGNDCFEFAASEFEPIDGEIIVDKIVDFQEDGFDDIIKIFGVGENSTVAYDAETGFVTIDGNEVIDIGEGLSIEVEKNENDTWELF